MLVLCFYIYTVKTKRKLQRAIIAGVLIVLAVVEVAFLVDNYDGTKRALQMSAHRDFRLQLAHKKDSLFKAGGLDLLLKELAGAFDSTNTFHFPGNGFDEGKSKIEFKHHSPKARIEIRADGFSLDSNIQKNIERWVNLEKVDSLVTITDSATSFRTIKLETINADTFITKNDSNANLFKGDFHFGPKSWHKRNPKSDNIAPKEVYKAMAPNIVLAFFIWLLVATVLFYGYKSIEKSRKLLALKDDFVANFSHELKTPVSAVKIALESIRAQADLSKQSAEYISYSQVEVLRLEHLLEKVLDANKLSSGKPSVVLSTVNISTLLTEMGQYFEPLVKIEKQVLSINVAEDTIAETDRAMLKAALSNIIENAIKYNKGEVVAVETAVTNGKLRIEVRNTGSEIPKEYQSQIFERYFRVPSGNVHNVKGHGLGLFFAKTMVGYLKGNIEYSYKDGKNCFTIIIPQ